jgi:plasmid rolling circle replication initiator protein Rep
MLEKDFSLDDTIIAQTTAKVKWTEKKIKNLEVARKLYKLAQMTEDAAERLQTIGADGEAYIERLRAEEYRKRSNRMKECSRFITMSMCPDCGRSVASSATLCRDRICPTCSWRLAAKQSVEMLHTLAYVTDICDYDALFLTLTVQNCEPDQLAPTLEMMSEAWHRMMMRRKNKEMIKGTARSVEVTYNAKTKKFHPHFHIIMLVSKDSGSVGELNFYFNLEWKKACNIIYTPITDLRKIENKTVLEYDQPEAEKYKKAILETFKYTIKDDSLQNMPFAIFRHFIDGIKDKRLVSYTGIIKEARAEMQFTDEIEDETPEKRCPDCNSEMLSAVYQWSFSENTYKRFVETVNR